MITSQLQGPINQSKSVLIIGFGSRGSLYAKCIAQREGFSLEGVVKNHHEPKGHGIWFTRGSFYFG